MQYLFVASGSLTLFIIALILGKQNKYLANRILVVWLILFVANLISLFVLYEATLPFSLGQHLILEFSEVSIFAHGPLLWLYTKSLTEESFYLKWEHSYHFVPFGIGYTLFLIQIFSGTEMASILRNSITILKMGSLLVYLVLVLVKLKGHRARVAHIFSNVEHKNLGWISFLSWGILMIWFIAGSGLLLDRFTAIVIPQYGGMIAHIAICLFIFLMGYFGLHQPSVFMEHTYPDSDSANVSKRETTVANSSKYRNSGLDAKGSKQIQQALLELIKTTRPYLDKELTLYNLAERLKVQPNHLSQVINSLEGKNFFDFINMYRVEAAKEKIQLGDHRNLTLLGIAFESGFNSKASFNRAFKKFTGQTPTEFKKHTS
ncbi:AraC family transcriptional regulator [Ulvibacterium sp.]|uniref:helix-turn-helix domain-containing protein n=1 Tax=Ulvibacterium sp. TaxID=2665914 RepID=UPI002626DCCE|nr:helix-turn-helix domain-containing protein [Ulvibacterium sp.]